MNYLLIHTAKYFDLIRSVTDLTQQMAFFYGTFYVDEMGWKGGREGGGSEILQVDRLSKR